MGALGGVVSSHKTGDAVHHVQGSTFWRQHKLFEELVLALVNSSRQPVEEDCCTENHCTDVLKGHHQWDEDEACLLLPERTSFMFTEEDVLEQMLDRVRDNCPELIKNRRVFLQAVERIVFSTSRQLQRV